MKDCVQYIRVSSEEQSKGGSLGAQKREGTDYIEKHGFDCIATFQDVETAKSAGREEFGKMLEFIQKYKKPVVLIVEKTDRLYRNLEDHIAISKLITEKGLQVHLYKENEVLNKGTNSHKKLMHRFKLIMAQNYVENLSEEIKKGRQEKLLAGGWPHRAPHGYYNDKNTRTIKIDEQAAPYIREAFQLFSSGLYSIERLSAKLFEEGFFYKPNMPKMSKAGLGKMLRNPFYIGDMEIEGITYPGNHEPLISTETWLKTQEALGDTSKPLKYGVLDFKYGHILRCHTCGASMVGENKKNGRYTYYRCSRRKYGCTQGYVNESKLNKEFDGIVESLVIPANWKQEIIEAAADLADTIEDRTSEEIGKAEAERTRLRTTYKKALFEKLNGTIDEDVWNELHQEYQEAIRRVDIRIENITRADIKFLQVAKAWVELPEVLNRRWNKATIETKLKILSWLGSNYSVEGEKVHYELKEPFSLIGKQALRQTWWTMKEKV